MSTKPEKPAIFFSHSSHDKKSLVKLKELFVAKTGGTIDVFLSSDGQSIPLGRNWVHRVEEGLNVAKLMLSFITSHSLGSDWLFFESGYVYAKGIRVVPVGFLGTDLKQLRPPLSLLQGFNITSHEGLDNLIALANDEFDYKHSPGFTPEEFHLITSLSSAPKAAFFGQYAWHIDEVHVQFKDVINPSRDQTVATVIEICNRMNVEISEKTKGRPLSIHGGFFNVNDKNGDLLAYLDAVSFGVTLPVVVEIARALRHEGVRGLPLQVVCDGNVTAITALHKVSSRLITNNIKFSTEGLLSYRDISFNVVERTDQPATIYCVVHRDEFPSEVLTELVNLLFENDVLRTRF